MSKVIKLRPDDIKISKMFCECGHTLEYWLGDNDCAYGICPSCDCNNPTPYHEANVIKYVCRHKSKNGKQDLLKAKHYIDLLIAAAYP